MADPMIFGSLQQRLQAARPCEFLGVGPVLSGNVHNESLNEHPDSPSAFIQWKGTDVCLDFYCPCGNENSGHFDGDFAYALKCVDCGRVFAMPSTVPLVEIGPEAGHYDSAKTTERDQW